MEINNEFDDIRPYRDEEVQKVMARLVKDPVFDKVLLKIFQKDVIISKVKKQMKSISDISTFQKALIIPIINNIIRSSTNGITLGGIEKLQKDKSYLFISNHRDIILDSALMNLGIYNHGLKTTEVAIGSNLLIHQWIEDIVKLNRAFVVKRNVPGKKMLAASATLSEYIRKTISDNGQSVWIAQREGRTKDGADETQVALLKMLNMSNGGELDKGFNELNIVPVSISYEIEPCGNEKVAELLMRNEDPNYKKTEQDDLWSMASGLDNQKGRIHFHFGEPVKEEKLKVLAAPGNKNNAFRSLSSFIDRSIYENYRLWPNNYIAYDMLYRTEKYCNKYSQEDKGQFNILTNERLSLVNANSADAKKLWLKMYSAPVRNFESVCQ